MLSAASRDNSSPACWPLRAWVLVTLCWMSPLVRVLPPKLRARLSGPAAASLRPISRSHARESARASWRGAERFPRCRGWPAAQLSRSAVRRSAMRHGTHAVSGSDARPRGVPGTHGGPWRSFRAVGFAASTQRRPPRAQEIPEKEVIGVSRGSRAVPSSKLIRWRQPAHGDQARGARPVNCTEPFA